MSHVAKFNLRRVGAAALLIFFGVPGCADERPACFPVRGEVRQAGKPLAEAQVTLHPIGQSSAVLQKPIAFTDAEGRFEMTTFRTHDGAVPGAYVITVELRVPRMVGEELVRDGRNILPTRFSKPESSGLKCEVTAAENNLPVIEIPLK